MKILNFGSCNIDYVYNVSEFVRAGETILALSTLEHPGGKGLNQAVAAARAGANALLGEAYIKSVTADFARGDICMLQNEAPCTDFIIKQAKACGMTVIWNPSPMNERITDSAIGMCDYIIVNKTEGRVLTGKEEPDDILKALLKKYPHTKAVLTLGKNGSIYSDGENKVQQAAFKADPVDTTGAGDTFTGYFAVMISKGSSIEETLKIASAAAALATEKQGAASSVPMLAEVIKKTEENI